MSITSALNTALSGMNAASTMLSVAADNIANLNSSGYRQQQANLQSLPNFGGAAVVSITAGPNQNPVDPNGNQNSNVDLTDQIVQLSKAKTLYNASAAVVRLSNQMTGSLLDIMAGDDNGHS